MKYSIMPDMRRPDLFEVVESDWEGFVSMLNSAPAVTNKTSAPMVKLAELKSHRGASGIGNVYGIEGDYDGGIVRPEKAAELLEQAGIKAVVVTTWNHTPNKPRWRVFSPLQEPVELTQRAQYVDTLNEALGGILSTESWVPSQCYFIGKNANHPEYFKYICVDGSNVEPKELEFEDIAPRETVQRVDTDVLISRLSSGEDVHNSARTIIARMVRMGLGDSELQLLMEALRTRIRDSRGEKRAQEFEKEFERMARGAIEKGFAVMRAGPFVPSKFTYHDAAKTSMTPQVHVENLYYSNLGQLIGAGGQGKSTVVLYELMMASLGRDIWGNKTHKPATCVVITAEDEDHMWAARLARLCDGNGLTESETAQVFNRIMFHYVGEINARLTQIHNDTVEVSSWADDVIESLDPFRPDIVVFDPAVSFGVGESRVNDAEQGLVMAARRLIGGLGCSVNYIHHTGKSNARERMTDQYAGRGGSALSDGSRVVRVLNTYFGNKKEDVDEWLKMTGHTLGDSESGLRITTPKLTYASPPPEVFVLRSGWKFTHLEPMTEEECQYAQELRELQKSQRLWDWLKSEESQGRSWSKRQLALMSKQDRAKSIGDMTRVECEKLVDSMTAAGFLETLDMGSNKVKLNPVSRPEEAM